MITDTFYKNLLENLFDGVYFVDRNRKILYWNKGAEGITGFKNSEVIGKQCSDILNYIDDSGISRCTTTCPLFAIMADSVPRKEELYLQHKDGYRIPVLLQVTPILDSQKQFLGTAEIFRDNTAKMIVEQKVRELEKLALLDPLTELANRRYSTIRLLAKLEERRRYGWPFGVLLIGIDHFKEIGDTYGRDVGNKVLQMEAKTLLYNMRISDTIRRWEDDEFIVLTVCGNENQLYTIANRLCTLSEHANLPIGSNSIQVTVSIGATFVQPNDTEDTIMARADRLLYYSMAGGRNRVTIKRD